MLQKSALLYVRGFPVGRVHALAAGDPDAAVGVGAFPSVSDAAGRLVRPDKRYVPSGADYEDAYRRFAALDEKMNTIPKGTDHV